MEKSFPPMALQLAFRSASFSDSQSEILSSQVRLLQAKTCLLQLTFLMLGLPKASLSTALLTTDLPTPISLR